MVKSKQLKIMCPKMLLNQLHWCKNLSLHGFYYILRVTKDNIFGFNPLFSLVSWCRHGLSSVTYYQPGFSTTSPLYTSSKHTLSIAPCHVPTFFLASIMLQIFPLPLDGFLKLYSAHGNPLNISVWDTVLEIVIRLWPGDRIKRQNIRCRCNS